MRSAIGRLPHFLIGSTLPNWAQLRRQGRIDSAYRRRALAITAGCLVGAPFRLYDRLRYGPRVARAVLDASPVFLIGHWQTGHSLLHYLMACDPQLGTLSLLHCMFPSCFLGSGPLLRRWLCDRLPRTRGVDTLPMGFDAPQGDDFALANLSDLSFYHCYVLPAEAERTFARRVLFDGATPRELARWQQSYLWLLRKVALDTGRSRLLLRNASNTGRIPVLLAMFPHAKFIHVYRNPYDVYAALSRRWEALLSSWALQRYELGAMEELTLRFFELLVGRYFKDREHIPDGNLAEVRYEELEADPVGVLEGVYDRLGLPGFEAARPRFECFARTREGAIGRGHPLAPEAALRVRKRWGFAIDRWGYTASA